MKGKEKILANFAGSSLVSLLEKGNIQYVEELYNPNNYFSKVFHFSFGKKDLEVKIRNKTIKPILLRTIYLHSFLKYINIPYTFYQLMVFFKSNNIQIIRVRGTSSAGRLLALIVGKIYHIPIVVSIGGNDRLAQERNKKFAYNSKFLSYHLEELLLMKANIVIVPNYYTFRYAVSLGVQRKKIRIIPWRLTTDIYKGKVNSNRIDICKTFRINPEKPYILNISALSRYKYINELILVTKKLLRSKIDIQVVFCGEGPLRAEIERELTPCSNNKVFVLGWQSSEVIKVLIENAYLMWIPMSGFVILEAAAFSKPIIASNIEWHSEFIKHGENGFVVDPNNIDAILFYTLKLLKDTKLAEEYGKKSREKLEMEYNPGLLANKEIKIYEELLI